MNLYPPDVRQLLIEEFKAQGDHRRSSEAAALSAQIDDTRRGQVHGFWVSLAMIAGAVGSAYLHEPVVGTALVGAVAAAIVTAFIRGRHAPDDGASDTEDDKDKGRQVS